ncbi:MAG TPA: hypothetical protein VFD58_05000 [Blastocatellia bacterium]|nr:hypothetical protein [Blastocatellia bacterium]
MKRSICILLVITLLAPLQATTVARTAPAADDPADALKRMAAEIRQLRLEVIEQAIEFQQWKLTHLEREMLAVRSEQQRLRELESSIQQQLAGLAPSAGHDPGAEQMGELEIVKATHTEDGLKPIQLKLQALAEREARLSEEISRENTRLQELQQKAGKLRAGD